MPRGWVEHAVLGLDGWLRERQGVYEFSDDPLCIFRVQRAQADCELALSGGVHVRPGAPVLNLHLWNEHVPPMGSSAVSMAWAREFTRRIDFSLRALASHLRCYGSLDGVVAIRANMRLGTIEQSAQLVRVAARYGFESAGADDLDSGIGTVQRLAENLFISLLVLVTNPIALRMRVLRRHHSLVYLSRAVLETRYAPASGIQDKRGAKELC